MDFQFQVGQEVYIRCEKIPGTNTRITRQYPARLGRIAEKREEPKEPGLYDYLVSGDVSDMGWGFNSSDLSPIFTFRGKRYVWKGEERIPELGEIVIAEFPSDVKGQPFRTQNINLNRSRKILKPLEEEPMEGVNIDSASYQRQSLKWKSIKPITFTALIDAGAREPTLTNAMMRKAIERGYNVSDEIELNDAQLIAEELGEGDWLRRHGYIEKVEPEQSYHVGQRFKSFGPFPGFYRLAGIRSSVALVGEVSWGFWRLPISVKDCGAITEDEFVQIAGTTYKFELIS